MKIIVSDVQRAFPEMTVPNISGYYSECIDKWKNIFENNPPWKSTKKSGLHSKGDRKLNMLNTAKVLCDCFSELTFSEQVNIVIDDKEYQEYANDCLDKNGFWKHMPEFIAQTYALGGGSIKIYICDRKPVIDYIHADRFLPCGWNGKSITDGIFSSQIYKNGSYYNFYERYSGGMVDYRLFKSSQSYAVGERIMLSELFSGLPDKTVYADSEIPMFSYFKPSVSNNYEYDVPLGMSIYANALDTLKALDIAFDSFSREFVLGKKRIIVPAQCIQTVVNHETGQMERYFDADDEAFVALKTEDSENLKITDNTVALRVDEHVSAINALLNILCFQVGLSAGTLSFDAVQGMKTATEVISQDSKTARTIKNNKNLFAENIETVVHALIATGIYLNAIPKKKYSVTVSWNDNIIIDDNTLIDNNIKLVQAGLKSKLKAIMDVQKCDEKTALEEIERISKEQSVNGLAVDDFMNGSETDDEITDTADEPGNV